MGYWNVLVKPKIISAQHLLRSVQLASPMPNKKKSIQPIVKQPLMIENAPPNMSIISNMTQPDFSEANNTVDTISDDNEATNSNVTSTQIEDGFDADDFEFFLPPSKRLRPARKHASKWIKKPA